MHNCVECGEDSGLFGLCDGCFAQLHRHELPKLLDDQKADSERNKRTLNRLFAIMVNSPADFPASS